MSDATGFWETQETPGPEVVVIDGVEVRRGSRVRLRPHGGGDVFDLALAGRAAIVEGLDHADDGAVHVAVVLADDPGRDLGQARYPGHRFFFAADEVEPMPAYEPAARAERRVLVAGIGNVFLGDDGFGVAVADRLAKRELPSGVEVVDFGIRGLDLAYAMHDGYDAVIFVDAAPRGEPPGTLSVVEPETGAGTDVVIDSHGMDPAKVLSLASAVGGALPRTLVVACEPETVIDGAHDDDLVGELSAPVEAAIDGAVKLCERLIGELLAQPQDGTSDNDPKGGSSTWASGS